MESVAHPYLPLSVGGRRAGPAADSRAPLLGGSDRGVPAPLVALVPPRERHPKPVSESARFPSSGGNGGTLRGGRRGQRRGGQEHGVPSAPSPDLTLAGEPDSRVGQHRRLSLPEPHSAIAGLDGPQGLPRELRPASA